MFIGREAELQFLENRYHAGGGQLVVLCGTYKLTDNFFRFWYAFAFTNYSDLEAGDVDGVYTYEIEPFLHEYASFTFEEVSRQSAPGIGDGADC